MEEYRELTTFFSNYIDRHPNCAEAFHLRGASHWYAGRLQEALADYNKSLELKPNDAAALSGRGQVLVELSDYRRALEDLDKALQFVEWAITDVSQKTHLEAFTRNGRAAALAGLTNFASALEEFEKSIKLCPENAWVYFNRAQAYHNRGDSARAVEDYKLALQKKQPKLTPLKRELAQKIVDAS
jgi:tetratricopeptide (TPR) repeat protein